MPGNCERRERRPRPSGSSGKNCYVWDGRERTWKSAIASSPEKLKLTARLRWETTRTIERIAQRLHLGIWKGAPTRIHRLKQKREQQGVTSLL